MTGGAERAGGGERVYGVLVTAPGVDADAVAREANLRLADPQKIRRALVWPEAALPRTEGTRKLKRALIRDWANNGGPPPATRGGTDQLTALIGKYAGRADIAAGTARALAGHRGPALRIDTLRLRLPEGAGRAQIEDAVREAIARRTRRP